VTNSVNNDDPLNGKQPIMASESKTNLGEWVRVICVARQDAKRVKTFLELNGLINKDFRMTCAPKGDGNTRESSVAIPILEKCNEKSVKDFSIESFGSTHFCPYSTTQLGNNRYRNQGGQHETPSLSLVQRGLWNVAKKYASITSSPSPWRSAQRA
jgi:hypothetical protein